MRVVRAWLYRTAHADRREGSGEGFGRLGKRFGRNALGRRNVSDQEEQQSFERRNGAQISGKSGPTTGHSGGACAAMATAVREYIRSYGHRSTRSGEFSYICGSDEEF